MGGEPAELRAMLLRVWCAIMGLAAVWTAEGGGGWPALGHPVWEGADCLSVRTGVVYRQPETAGQLN
jgi:hypothetical protein